MTDFSYSSEDSSAIRVAVKELEAVERLSFKLGIAGMLPFPFISMYNSGNAFALKSVNPRMVISSLFLGAMT